MDDFSKTSVMGLFSRSLMAVSIIGLLFSGCSSKTPPSKAGISSSKRAQKSYKRQFESKSPSKEQITAMSQQNIDFHELSNGLQLFMVSKKDIPMTTVLIGVRNGSFVETAENNGLAHLYEHMFFKANEKIPSQPEFMKALDQLGIELGPNMNAYTSTESVRYFFTLQKQYLEKGFAFMADALLTPKFLQDELEKERKVVIGEFDRHEASPTDIFFQKSLLSRLFPDHFIRKNVIGSRPVVEGATREQMFEIKDRYYIPNNSSLFIVGDFDKDQTIKWVEKYFSKWKRGPDPFVFYPVPEHPPLKKTNSFTENAAVNTTNIILAFQGPKLTKDNQASTSFDLISLMTSMESSPFQKELVHSGLATSASFFTWSQRFTSPMFFSLETTPEKAQAAYEKLVELINRMNKGNFFKEADLEIAKTSVEVNSAYDRESGQRFALSLASVWSSTGNLDYYLNYVPDVKKTTMAQIEGAIQSYINDKPHVISALAPENAQPIQYEVAAQ
jgi:zinc protease